MAITVDNYKCQAFGAEPFYWLIRAMGLRLVAAKIKIDFGAEALLSADDDELPEFCLSL